MAWKGFREIFYEMKFLKKLDFEDFHELDKYMDIEGVDEFKQLIFKLNENNFFEKILKKVDYYSNLMTDEKIEKKLYINYLPFFKLTWEFLGGNFFLNYLNYKYFAGYTYINSMSFLIEFNYFYHNQDKGVVEIFKKSCGGDFIANLSKNVDEVFNKSYIPYNKEKLLTDISKVDFHDRRAKDLQMTMEALATYSVIEFDGAGDFIRTIKFSGLYLAACSAVKHERNVTCEDIVIGANLALKLLFDDLTEYIERDYSEFKVSKYDIFKNLDEE